MLLNRFGTRRILSLFSSVLLAAVMMASSYQVFGQTTHPPATANPVSSTAEAPPPVHDPSLPPINCPLRKHGIDPNKLRPFDEVEEYIAFLEGPDRALWQKPDQVVAALDLEGTETVVDLGAGSGYFTFRLANALPRGRVIASDIEPEMIRHIHRKAMTEGVQNIQAELVQRTDPELPDGVDLVFVCDVLLHVKNRPTWLAKLAGEMQPGARMALIEFRDGDLPQGPPEAMKIPRDKIIELAAGAGLKLISEYTDLLPYQVYLIFKKS